jgi:hypothetical protein
VPEKEDGGRQMEKRGGKEAGESPREGGVRKKGLN